MSAPPSCCCCASTSLLLSHSLTLPLESRWPPLSKWGTLTLIIVVVLSLSLSLSPPPPSPLLLSLSLPIPSMSGPSRNKRLCEWRGERARGGTEEMGKPSSPSSPPPARGARRRGARPRGARRLPLEARASQPTALRSQHAPGADGSGGRQGACGAVHRGRAVKQGFLLGVRK